MLHELTISDLGVIESARLEFGPGLTCVTGETGAGKTMVLTGLGLILGAKTVPATVRTGADAAVAEAIIDVPAAGPLAERLADAGVAVEEDGSAVVARTVGATTRSRAVMGGRTVPQTLLGEVAAELVTVHGQSDQVRLRSPARQRDTLDAYGGAETADARRDYAAAWDEWLTAAERLRRMQEGADAERAEVARLRDDLAAIDAVAPEAGEDAALVAEAGVLENAEAVRTGAAAAYEAIAGDEAITVVATLEAARRALADAARHDSALAALEERLADYSYGATDVGAELASYLDRLDADPGRLDEINQRRSDLATLTRRIGVPDVDGVLAYAERARPRVEEDDAWDETLVARREDEARCRAALEAAATTLHDARAAVGERLARAVRDELALLAMPDADIAIAVERTEPTAHGADVVTMTLASHPGAPHRPVADAASGGELSRIMLAIEVSLAGADHESDDTARTFIFDEVDAGVGGKAAVAVGNRLAQLARTHQVIVVTHLAQVAAFADTHVVVAKSTDGAVTRAQVGAVTGEDRVQEIARLLSGQEDSTTARAHALELLEGSAVAR
ncbi:DNA repair protein RecN [Demequina muriae]|uniref:DNA repair protein RecN n=1 Tax=Demequina muriae TaxID=3051664 RepID=A0ABT8GDP0_9MICO|nr:DNA repair protein RecN [Demequina sp. EGI L300058]MDN4479389.1 DNA repair protein RecN [Demequina sp. EGI L300058]